MKPKINKAELWVWLLAALFCLPFLALLSQLILPEIDIWRHLTETVLTTYFSQSVWLLFWVALGTLLVGVSTAWLVASYIFPGQRQFQWLLILPMSMPAYIMAYAYTWWLDVAGPLQSNLRELFGWSFGDYFFPNIRSLSGAILVLTIALYPYVYLLARTAFEQQSKQLYEAHQLAGGNHFFRKIALPLARPAIFGGLALVMMETLADFGTVEYFGVSTLTTGIMKTWFGMGSLAGASQIASILLIMVVLIMLVERTLRGSSRYDAVNNAQPSTHKIQLLGWRKWLVFCWCGLIVVLGFILPVLLLTFMALQSQITNWWSDFINLLLNTVSLAGVTALLTVGLALLLMFIKRHSKHATTHRMIRGMSLGYAVPGLVIAVGVVMAFGWLDQTLNWIRSSFSDAPASLIFSGGFLALISAYVIRFLAVAIQPLDAAYQGINKHFDEASLLTGKRSFQTFRYIHLPLLKSSLWTALLLVFVDLLKELPATLVLRPFNFNTLAVKAYELASDERLADAAIPALCIVAVSLLPVLLLNKRINQNHV